MMGAAAEEAPAAWIAPQSESEPPPMSVGTREEVHTRSSDPRREPSAPMTLTAPIADSVAPPPGPQIDEEERVSKLSEQPRLTMVGDAPGAPYRPRSMPALPRPASASGALDLETLDKIALDPSAPLAERVRALKTLGEAAHEGGRGDEATRHFISALELGDIAAGDQAAELLALMPGRANDLLLVRRRQAFLAPGDRALLDALHHAAMQVRDLIFARAIDHVRRAFDPVAGPVPPPALESQLDRPDLVMRLTWEHANPAFRKHSAATQGTERVSGAIPIGRAVQAAGRLLGAARTPVFIRNRPGRDVEIVLLTPPALILGGDCREDSADVRYVLGAGLVAAHPAHCLLLAQSEESARGTWQALLSAFGPPDHGRGASPEASRLAASLWQSIPRAAQRRLGELLGNNPPTFESALDGARQVARRGGLYLSGDLNAAVRSTLAEIGETQLLAGPNPDLTALCQQHSRVADLFRLATSPEFAEARWRTPGRPPA
jgi:cellulose synthase operon protein C